MMVSMPLRQPLSLSSSLSRSQKQLQEQPNKKNNNNNSSSSSTTNKQQYIHKKIILPVNFQATIWQQLGNDMRPPIPAVFTMNTVATATIATNTNPNSNPMTTAIIPHSVFAGPWNASYTAMPLPHTKSTPLSDKQIVPARRQLHSQSNHKPSIIPKILNTQPQIACKDNQNNTKTIPVFVHSTCVMAKASRHATGLGVSDLCIDIDSPMCDVCSSARSMP